MLAIKLLGQLLMRLVGCFLILGLLFSTQARAGDASLRSVKVGVLLGFSGVLSSLAAAVEAGARLAVEQANAAGGLYGLPIELVRANTKLKANQANKAVVRLANRGVPAVMGALSSRVTAGAIRAAAKHQVVLVSPSATASFLTNVKDRGFFFRTVATEALSAQFLAKLAQKRGYRRVAVIYSQAATDLAGHFSKTLAAGGTTKLVGKLAYVPAKALFRPITSLMRRQPDALMLFVFPEDSKAILRVLAKVEYRGAFLLHDSMKTPFVTAGTYQKLLEDAWGVSIVTEGLKRATQFEKDYAKLEKSRADASFSYRAEAYDAMSLILLAIAAVGEEYTSLSSQQQARAIQRKLFQVANPLGKPVGYQQFSKAIKLLNKHKEIDYQGPSGDITFNAAGDNTEAVFEVWQVHAGRIERDSLHNWQ